MQSYLAEQLSNGLTLGLVYAMLALGVSLIFGASRLVNFAHGSLVMAGAYAAWFLSARAGCPFWLALPAAMAVGAGLAWLLDLAAVRPFADRPGAGLLSSLAAGLVLDQAAQLLWGPKTQAFPSPLGGERFALGAFTVGWPDLLIAALVAASLAGLWVFLRRHPWGLALRAVAQDAEAAAQMGMPVKRVRALAFALSGALAGMAGALVAVYYQSLAPNMGFGLAVKGFAAAILGGLGSLPAACAGGLALGLGEVLGVSLFGSDSRRLFAYLVIVVVLVWRPGGLFARRAAAPAETVLAPAGGRELAPPGWSLPLLALAALSPLALGDPYLLQIGLNAWILVPLALSVTLCAGQAGITVLGQAGFAALGAYAGSLLSLRLGWSFLPAAAAAALLPALFAGLALRGVVRLQGHQIALASLALGELVNQAILAAEPLTGGALGLAGIPAPRVGPWTFDSLPAFYLLALACAILALALALALRRGRLGRGWRALRDDPAAAAALGLRVGARRGLALAVGAALAGLSGYLAAGNYGYINHESFASPLSILALTAALAGGLANPWGAALGALGLTVLGEALRPVGDLRWIAYGLVLVAALRWRPQGALGSR